MMENMKEMEKGNKIILCLFNLFFVNCKIMYGVEERGKDILNFFKVLFNLRDPDSTFSYTDGRGSLSQIYLITWGLILNGL